jgi:hypothetical protein
MSNWRMFRRPFVEPQAGKDGLQASPFLSSRPFGIFHGRALPMRLLSLLCGAVIVGSPLSACTSSGHAGPSPSALSNEQVIAAGRAAAQRFFDVTSAAQRAGTVGDRELMAVSDGDALAGSRELFKELEYQQAHVKGVANLRIISAALTGETPPKARLIGCVTGPASVVNSVGRKLRDAFSGPTGVEYVAAPSADGKWRVVSVGPASAPSC